MYHLPCIPRVIHAETLGDDPTGKSCESNIAFTLGDTNPTGKSSPAMYPLRFTADVLAEAHDYANHAGRKTTEVADLKLALATRNLAATAPSRQV